MVKTERLHIIPLNYYELVSRIYSRVGTVSVDDETERNVVNNTLVPMKDASKHDQLFYTFWLGYVNGEEVLETGFWCPPTKENVLEIWMHTRPEYQNKGYGTEAIKGMVKWASCFDDVSFVCAGIDKNNIPSQRMIEKAGFYYLTEVNYKYVFNFNVK